MVWRKFGASRLGLSSKTSRIVKLIRNLGNGGAGVSASGSEEESSEQSAFNVRAYIIGKQRQREAETEKAMLVSVSRYHRWNAGGPS